MKKILIICNKYPLPENTGANIRTMNFVRFFQTIGVLDIAHIDNASLQESHPFRNHYHLSLRKRDKGITGKLLQLLHQTPKGIYEYAKDTEKELFSLILNEKFDYILVRYIFSAKSLMKLPREIKDRIIIDVDDLPSDLHLSTEVSALSSLLSRLKWRLNSIFLSKFEKKCLSFGAVLFCSSDDRKKITQNKTELNTYIIPNILPDTPFSQYHFNNGYNNIDKLLFVGTLQYPPNIDGLNWFITNIFPALKKLYPEVSLDIIGRNPPAWFVLSTENDSSINILSDVPTLMSYYSRSGIAIVPILSGGGTRIKILEAGLASRPVMTTRLGAHGLGVTHRKEIMIFSNAQDFIESYAGLHDKTLYDLVTNNLKKIVTDKYSQTAFDSAMNRVIHEL